MLPFLHSKNHDDIGQVTVAEAGGGLVRLVWQTEVLGKPVLSASTSHYQPKRLKAQNNAITPPANLST